MKKFNKFTILFVGLVMSLLCIMMAYALCVDFFGWNDLTGLKERFHVSTLAELHPLRMLGLPLYFLYFLFIAFIVLGFIFVKNLRKHSFWTHGY